MVKKLKAILENVKKVMGGLTTSQKITLMMGAVMIFGALSALVWTATQTHYETLVSLTDLDTTARKELEQYLKENEVEYQSDGKMISVEAGSRNKIMMNLALDDKLAGTVNAYQWLEDLSPIKTPTPKAMDERLRISRALELEGTINSLNWVKSSKVTITIGADTHFLQGKRHPTKASVNIISRHHDFADQDKNVRAVRSLMTFAVPNLIVENVGIVIDGNTYIFKQKSAAASKYDEWTTRKINQEIQAEDKIKAFFLGEGGELGLVHKLRVSVSIELNRQVIEKQITKTIEDPLALRSSISGSSTKGNNAPVDEPGVSTNNNVAQNVVGDGSTILDAKEDRTIIEYKFGKEIETEFSEIPGAIKNVYVALVFDQDEMQEAGVLDFKDGMEPQAVIEKKLFKYKKQVANSLGITGDAINNNISVDAMKFANDVIKEKAGLQSVLMDVLEKSGGNFLLFGLSLFGFLYFVNVLRQAFDTPELEEEMDEEEIKRRTTDEDVARMLDAQAESLDDIRARHIEERVRSLVKEDPDTAGSLIQRWLMEDDNDD